jgi:large subunit ribosomal protein L29
MLIKEIRALQTPEIEAKLADAQLEQFKLRFQFRGGQLTDYTRLAAARRDIARMMTVLRERELAAQLAAKGE